MKRLFLVVLVLFVSQTGFSDIIDFGKNQEKAEVISQERSFIRLQLNTAPHLSLPVFVYEIEKVKSPFLTPQSVFKESAFLLGKGNLAFSDKEYDKAIAYYKKSLVVNPDFVLGYHNIGVSYFLMGEYNKSITNFEKILEEIPLNGPSYFYLGWIYKRLEHFKMAKQYLTNAKDIFQSQKESMFLLETQKLLKSLPDNLLY